MTAKKKTADKEQTLSSQLAIVIIYFSYLNVIK